MDFDENDAMRNCLSDLDGDDYGIMVLEKQGEFVDYREKLAEEQNVQMSNLEFKKISPFIAEVINNSEARSKIIFLGRNHGPRKVDNDFLWESFNM
jgi:hypothetical protein